jgi:hypothetical protein
MLDSLIQLLYLLNRYVHVIATAVIIGGTLFYEMIVPVAIGDLKQEQQLLVFGRARWTFRGVVWTCALLLVISGIVTSIRQWEDYTQPEQIAPPTTATVESRPDSESTMSGFRRPGWWWAAHVSTAAVGLLVAVALTSVRKPPEYAVQWMRLNLLILLLVVFFASATRDIRLMNAESARALREAHS